MRSHDAMAWPKDVIKLFARALDLEPAPGYTTEDVLQHMLDEAARRATWRAQGEPDRLEGCYRFPYTPLGSVVNEGMAKTAIRFTMYGDKWGAAVDALYAYVAEHAAEICDHFRDSQEPYRDRG